GAADGLRGGGAGADGAVDRSDFRPRAQPWFGGSAGAAGHDSYFSSQGFSFGSDAGFDPQCVDHGGGGYSDGVFRQGTVRLPGELFDQLRGFFRGDGFAADGIRPGGASGRAFL